MAIKAILLNMSKIALIIDASSDKTFLAISENGVIKKSYIIPDSRQLSKFLLPNVDTLIKGIRLDYIALGIGPGSFTGTRLGATVAKSLSFALEIPVFTFSSTLLPDLSAIGLFSYQKSQKELPDNQIELVYFSPTP